MVLENHNKVSAKAEWLTNKVLNMIHVPRDAFFATIQSLAIDEEEVERALKGILWKQ